MKIALLENTEATIELEDGILIGNWKSSFVDLSLAQLVVKYRLECTNNASYPMLLNIKSIKNITKPARDFLASEKGCEGIIAGAILIDSNIGSMIGNFFIRISKPLIPNKIFTDENAAKKWLAKYVTKD